MGAYGQTTLTPSNMRCTSYLMRQADRPYHPTSRFGTAAVVGYTAARPLVRRYLANSPRTGR